MLPSPLSLFTTWFVLQAAAAPAAGSQVLTPQDFKQTIADGVWFIEHFSPYCRHCRNFEPTWNRVVDKFEKQPDLGIHLAQVNCALNGDLCTENGVTGYPQMNLYRNGQFVETFTNDRDFDILVDFLLPHAEPTAISLSSPTAVEQEEMAAEIVPVGENSVVQVSQAESNPLGEVISLTSETFDDFVAQAPTFVKFFAPWCGHCKKLAPVWLQVARRMQHKLNIAEVNCDDFKSLCTKQGVTGYPMLFYYSHGAKTEYSGSRKYEPLVAFADKAASPTMQPISAHDLDKVVHEHPVAYVLLHSSSDEHIVSEVAKDSQLLLGSPPVFVSSSKELFTRYDIPTTESWVILAFKDNDPKEPTSIFNSSISDTLSTWLFANRLPTSLELSRDIFQHVMNAPHNPLVVIAATPNGVQNDVSSKLNDIAKKWRLRKSYVGRQDVVFTWMDADQWGKWMKSMYGVKVKDQPKVVVADHSRLVYWDRDTTGQPIQLNAVSIFSAIEGVYSNKIRSKHSENIMERLLRAFNSSLTNTEGFIIAHPYMAVLLILGFLAAVVMAIKKLLDDDTDLQSEHRYIKGGRLD
ncbi:thioredoxin-like protein [Suillus subalutaceus]|uniref:thioredoxin-like protein n=1 Tax=Suillus subalutaceus TaxID=48586 RepID=UPI001B88419F|nr:thioredoxin-like protein [Suillus subalutaceus]KAG1875422.1 thioredoxin-like protein [Suillus subalutaceus]